MQASTLQQLLKDKCQNCFIVDIKLCATAKCCNLELCKSCFFDADHACGPGPATMRFPRCLERCQYRLDFGWGACCWHRCQRAKCHEGLCNCQQDHRGKLMAHMISTPDRLHIVERVPLCPAAVPQCAAGAQQYLSSKAKHISRNKSKMRRRLSKLISRRKSNPLNQTQTQQLQCSEKLLIPFEVSSWKNRCASETRGWCRKMAGVRFLQLWRQRQQTLRRMMRIVKPSFARYAGSSQVGDQLNMIGSQPRLIATEKNHISMFTIHLWFLSWCGTMHEAGVLGMKDRH